jgi:hypothetical protein
MSWHGVHPELCRSLVSVTTDNSSRLCNSAGSFIYHHIKPEAFHFGFDEVEIDGKAVMVADPEKAVLDYFYAQGGEWTAGRIEAQRLEGDDLNLARLSEYAHAYNSPRVARAARRLAALMRKEQEGYHVVV